MCHQPTDPDKKADRQALQEAPLGYRIKRRANQAPVDSYTKTQVEQMKMQQGLQQITTFQKDRK